MKLYLALFLFAFVPVALFSRDITTLSGITYNNATVFDSNAGELIISYQDKDKPELTIIKPVPFSDLPNEIRKEYNYDPVKAEAFEKSRNELKKRGNENRNPANVTSPWSTGVSRGGASVNYSSLEGGIAPGEKNGAAEASAIRQEALQKNFAPGEKEGAAESSSIREEAMQDNRAPGEKESKAESRAIRREAAEKNRAPSELEGSAENRAIKREAFGNPKIPGE